MREDLFCYQHHPISRDAKADWQLAVPAVAAIGWIPFHDNLSPAGLSKVDEALDALVSLGNNPPPSRLSSPGEFVSFVQKKDFRAALALDEIKVGIDKTGTFTAVSFYNLIRCGYTPLPPKHRLIYWRGQGFGRPKVIASSDEIRVRCTLWFKLSKVTSLAARALSGFWPASASAEIEVVIVRRPLKVTVLFSGSAVPSQYHYIDWETCGCGYDMLADEPEEFEAFLKLGYCKDALSRCTHRTEFSAKQLRMTRVEIP